VRRRRNKPRLRDITAIVVALLALAWIGFWAVRWVHPGRPDIVPCTSRGCPLSIAPYSAMLITLG
jgi:hypothetical protein